MQTVAGRIRTVGTDERGVALVLTLLVVSALTISTAAVATLMISNEKAFGRDRQEVLALNAAEAGLNYGLSTLAATVDPTGSAGYGGSAWYPTTHQSSGTTVPFDDSAGKGTWWANKIDANTWRLYATGLSPNGHVTRQVSMKVRSATQPGTVIPASSTWSKGLFVGKPGPSCFSPGGSAVLTISLYVKGCIQFQGNVGIAEPSTSTGPSVQVYAETTISFGSGSASIGTASKKVYSVIAPGGCTGKSGKICSASGSNVYAQNYTGPSPNLTKPQVFPDAKYALGKWNTPTCSTGSFVFDNNTTRDSSLGTADLFPSSAYDCRVYNASGIEIGRLAWNPTTNVLIATGTIYIDGNLQMNSNTGAGYVTPSGTTPLGATIYVNETVSMNGTASLCGPPSVPSGGGCSGKWDPAYGSLFIVAINTSNSANPFAVGWSANGNAYYDLAAYVVGNYKNNGSSGVTGPVLTDTASVSGNGNSTDVPNPPPSAPGASYTSPGATTWGVIPASWAQLPAS
jgi:Tfp pilus assembly protein PilX